MTYFYTHLETPEGRESAFAALEFADLESAYLDACASLPALGKDLLSAGKDITQCSLKICNLENEELIQVLFSDIVKCGPHEICGLQTFSNHTASLFNQLMETDRRARAAERGIAIAIDEARALLEESKRLLRRRSAGEDSVSTVNQYCR